MGTDVPSQPINILAVGEVLWDVFPDGPRFGGAPANFACACAGLGWERVRVRLASAVGNDQLGVDAKARLRERSVDVSLMAIRPEPTGQVMVELDDQGRASYRFIEDPAWDHLELSDALLSVAKQADVTYFGTLGQRAELSRKTIRELLNAGSPSCLKVFDINLRPPHWTDDVLLSSFAFANVVKLNDEELPQVGKMLGLPVNERAAMEQLRTKFNLKLVALTRGSTGSLMLDSTGTSHELPAKPVKIVDTVGAGDAFTAALALGLAFGHPLEQLHQSAVNAAAFVCTQAGGTPVFPAGMRFL